MPLIQKPLNPQPMLVARQVLAQVVVNEKVKGLQMGGVRQRHSNPMQQLLVTYHVLMPQDLKMQQQLHLQQQLRGLRQLIEQP